MVVVQMADCMHRYGWNYIEVMHVEYQQQNPKGEDRSKFASIRLQLCIILCKKYVIHMGCVSLCSNLTLTTPYRYYGGYSSILERQLQL